MEFFAGALAHEGGKGLLLCSLEGNSIRKCETLSLIDPIYLLQVDGRSFPHP
ncbi:hypothetical protein [Ruthenibacterium lactatiformans]|uniref:hypothetical protein n=1 Tax=Ruthenibacterium lactatiformans TaxID=1550024 RepID=UPI003AB99781